jgi:uncharacterized protein (TIGR02246 family)
MRTQKSTRGGLLFAAAIAWMGCCWPAASQQIINSPNPTAVTAEQATSLAEIEQLVSEYSYRLDNGFAEQLAELFTEDAIFENRDNPTLKGRAEIAAFYAKRPKTRVTRHVSTNLRVVFLSPDRAIGNRVITYYMGNQGEPLLATPKGVGTYDEVYVRGADHRWRFHYRLGKSVFSNTRPTIVKTP